MTVDKELTMLKETALDYVMSTAVRHVIQMKTSLNNSFLNLISNKKKIDILFLLFCFYASSTVKICSNTSIIELKAKQEIITHVLQ